ncbi:aldo/keto reductase [Spirochaeta africana]|uniref:Putative oxidoreductase, aryl-alcohol dehydrogenase like protein n=1 Tax=Spirochaeta africana (strain ATCC 700263 / DSM 8902 / Z-7692) TaxID=889378 RepID=H9UK57_SPIAZ|nr:aldo/keto reductase [Spirochaeta africana]AFG37900.1 putative oxidoreductase, aryl-alcohol dehydrogenase like protein [Spirochaeta africana DSM 8902]
MQRSLGKSGITVSGLGFGGWAIGGPFWNGTEAVGWGRVDDSESIAAIHAALDAGINLIDTADVYGAGHGERVVGQALQGKRAGVVVATKFGNKFDETTRQITGSSGEPHYIQSACEESLRRLQTDYIDLYQFHLNDFPVEQADAVLEALERLVEQGKIRSYGWSTDFPERAELFARGRHCAAVQFQENVLDDNPEMIAMIDRLQLAGLNRGPLAMGLLSGKYSASSTLADDDVRGANSPAWMKYFRDGKPDPQWLKKLEAVREILTQDGRSLVQGAIGWLWARSEWTVPIPGIRTVEQARHNAAALAHGPLQASQMQQIQDIIS